MPRKPRFYQPNIPCHVIQRGNNRHYCFINDQDYHVYLSVLEEALTAHNIELHAYVLMTNHVHLLMTPTSQSGISKLMQHIGRKYVMYFNKQHKRTGTLWEGRHKGSLIDSDGYLLNCYRYIELNPVRALMTTSPEDYQWSSYSFNALGASNKLITPHSLYKNLGKDINARNNAYRGLFNKELTEYEVKQLRESVKHNYPLGSEDFRFKIERKLGFKIGEMVQGRPSKVKGY